MNTNQQHLIQRFSLFAGKECKKHLDNIIEVFEENFFTKPDDDLKDYDLNKDSTLKDIQMLSNLTISDKLFCNTCNCHFSDRDEQIHHYKSDLHRFNLKRKLNGKLCVTIDEFENLTDISSISGTDSSNDIYSSSSEGSSSNSSETNNRNTNVKSKDNKYGNIARNNPKISFRLNDTNILVMFRCLLHGKKNVPETSIDLLNQVKLFTNSDQWCIILVNAGHFAGAIFRGNEVILHKTFHRYVIRAKRGTVQSVHDDSGKHAKSAGANIRRHQETAFKDDIKSLLDQWKKELDKCKCIFLRAPKYNQQIFFAGRNPLFTKYDTRIRHIPFMTCRPTFNEAKRVHSLLSTIELYNSFYTREKTSKNQQKECENKQITKTEQNKLKIQNNDEDDTDDDDNDDNDDDDDDDSDSDSAQTDRFQRGKQSKRKLKTLQNEHAKKCKEMKNNFVNDLNLNSMKIFNELYSACKANDSIKLNDLCDKYNQNSKNNEECIKLSEILNQRFDSNGITLLYLVSSLGHCECIRVLLNYGADPTITDLQTNKVPYLIAKNKQVRDQFRRHMHDNPTQYDYTNAKIPSGLSIEKETEKRNKEKEKKRLQRKFKKERNAEVKQQQQTIEYENEEKRKFLSLTDEQKRMLMIDRRFINVTKTNSIKTKKLIEKYENTIGTLLTTNENNNESMLIDNLPKIISRCWYCGENLSSKIPFEYYDYKFCSTKCLKTHRQLNKNK